MGANDCLELEKKCECCGGTGVYYDDRCPDCEGRGSVVTELGSEILDFVTRRLRVVQNANS